MIRITRLEIPEDLTPDKVQELTAEYIADNNKRVWNKAYKTDRLKIMSHAKCCYCEAKLEEESKYMEVEHYYCKDKHPHKVVLWSNLLPICKRCNIQKGSYDCDVYGDIIDPTVHEPKSHLFLKDNFRLHHIDERGDRTIRELYLNDTARVGIKRFMVGQIVIESIEEMAKLFGQLQNDQESSGLQRKVRNQLLSILRQAEPSEAYSATAATCIIKSANYRMVKDGLAMLNLWDDRLQAAHNIAETASLIFQSEVA